MTCCVSSGICSLTHSLTHSGVSYLITQWRRRWITSSWRTTTSRFNEITNTSYRTAWPFWLGLKMIDELYGPSTQRRDKRLVTLSVCSTVSRDTDQHSETGQPYAHYLSLVVATATPTFNWPSSRPFLI